MFSNVPDRASGKSTSMPTACVHKSLAHLPVCNGDEVDLQRQVGHIEAVGVAGQVWVGAY